MMSTLFAIAMTALSASAVSKRLHSSHFLTAFPTQPTVEFQGIKNTTIDNTNGVKVTANITTDLHMLTSSPLEGRTEESNQAFDFDVRWESDTKAFVQLPTLGKIRHPQAPALNITTRFRPMTLTAVPDHDKVFITCNYSWYSEIGMFMGLYPSNTPQLGPHPLRPIPRRSQGLTVFAKYITFKFPDDVHEYRWYEENGVALSFHKRSDQMLQPAYKTHWWMSQQLNCSVPHWQDFDVHFRCNLEVDCVGGEDEMGCPYSGHCGVGRVTVNNRCYEITRKSETTIQIWITLDLASS